MGYDFSYDSFRAVEAAFKPEFPRLKIVPLSTMPIGVWSAQWIERLSHRSRHNWEAIQAELTDPFKPGGTGMAIFADDRHKPRELCVLVSGEVDSRYNQSSYFNIENIEATSRQGHMFDGQVLPVVLASAEILARENGLRFVRSMLPRLEDHPAHLGRGYELRGPSVHQNYFLKDVTPR